MSTINIVFLKQTGKNKLHTFGSDKIHTLSSPASVNRVSVHGKQYKLNIYVSNFAEVNYEKMAHFKKFTVIFVVISVVEGFSSMRVLYRWKIARNHFDFSSFPIILVGCDTDLRNDSEHFQLLKAVGYQDLTPDMGKKLAHRMKATKYLECNLSEEADFNVIFEEAVSASLLYVKRKPRKLSKDYFGPLSMDIAVMGTSGSRKLDMVNSFVFSERLDVCGENLNEQTYFYFDINETKNFDALIEINGETHELHIRKEDINLDEQVLRVCDVIILTFSVVNQNSYLAITNDLVQEIRDKFGRRNLIFDLPIILVGNQTLKNTTDTENYFPKPEMPPITFEMGEQLARNINAVKYMECSRSDRAGIHKVFEEAVWAALREFEQIYAFHKKHKSKQSFFKRIFGR